jgi:ankyrin repeat protein
MDLCGKSYLKILILIILSSLPFRMYSQVVLDTTMTLHNPLTADEQNDLNNYLLLASSSGSMVAIDWLVKHGADVNFKTAEGATPLMLAVSENMTLAAKMLMYNNADVNIKTDYSETPLLAAAKNGNMEIAEALIRDSAKINFTDKQGASALHYAAAYGYFYFTDMLLYYDADVNIRSNDGTSPLMAAIFSDYADIADLLIQHGSNCEQKDNQGFTPLMVACQVGDTTILKLLIKEKVSFYEINNYRYDAMDIAIRSDNINVLEFILNTGYSWTKRKPGTINPYSVALKFDRPEIISLLKSYNIPENLITGFDRVVLSASGRFTSNDHFMGGSVSLNDPRYKGGIIIGADFKPSYSKVLMKTAEKTYYQYLDKSALIYGGLYKDFPLTRNSFSSNWVLTVSATAAYGLGNKLVGTEIEPWNKLLFIPSVAIKRTGNKLAAFASLDYMKTPFYKIGPVWFRAGVSYTLFFDQYRTALKKIKWLNSSQ